MIRYRFADGVDAELVEDVLNVVPNSRVAYMQEHRGFVQIGIVGEQSEDFHFPLRERVSRGLIY